CFSPISFL
ncbi:penicillin-binding Protein dimerization domain protein, partial [Chlamydia psittaci 84-8471/1]